MKKFQLKLSFLILFTASAGLPLTAGFAYADSAKEYRTNFCSKKKNNQGNWQKTHYAFATNAEGDRCGYSWNHDNKNAAIFSAKKNCERKAKTPCKLVYAN